VRWICLLRLIERQCCLLEGLIVAFPPQLVIINGFEEVPTKFLKTNPVLYVFDESKQSVDPAERDKTSLS